MIYKLEFKARGYKRKGRSNVKAGTLPTAIKKLLTKSVDILDKNGIDKEVNIKNYFGA